MEYRIACEHRWSSYPSRTKSDGSSCQDRDHGSASFHPVDSSCIAKQRQLGDPILHNILGQRRRNAQPTFARCSIDKCVGGRPDGRNNVQIHSESQKHLRLRALVTRVPGARLRPPRPSGHSNRYDWKHCHSRDCRLASSRRSLSSDRSVLGCPAKE